MTLAVENANPPPNSKPRVALKRKKWVVGIAVALIAIFFVAFATENSRQHSAGTALERLNHAGIKARNHFGDIDDWREWYRSRLTSSDGCAAWQAWVRKWGAQWDSTLKAQQDLWMALDESAPGEPDAAKETEVLAALLASDNAVLEARGLLIYDNFNGMPEFASGQPILDPIPQLNAMSILQSRADLQAWLGNRAAAFDELLLLLELDRRLSRPCSAVEWMLISGRAIAAFSSLERLLETGNLAAELVESLRQTAAAPNVDRVALCEGELALTVQMLGLGTQEFEDAVQSASWFDWVDLSRGPAENWESFRGGNSWIREQTDYIETLLAVVTTGQTRAPVQDSDAFYDLVFCRVSTVEAQKHLRLQRLLAASEVRGMEAAGAELGTLAFPKSSFPELDARFDSDVLYLRFAPGANRDVAFGEAAGEWALDEMNPPLAMKPSR